MDKLDQFVGKYGPFLKQVRKRLMIVLLFFVAFFIVGFVFFRQIIAVFLGLFDLGQVEMIATSPFQIFSLAANAGFFLAIVLTLPLLLINLFAFIRPALKKEERRLILPLGLASLLLFILGFSLGLVLIRFLITGFSSSLAIAGVSNFWDIGLFLSQVLLTPALLGFIFQFPLALYFLLRLGIVRLKTLEEKRPLIIAGVFIFVVLLPPTDALSLVLMAVPILILFELTLFLLKRQMKRGGERICLAG